MSAELKRIDIIKERFWDTISSGLPADFDLEVLRKILLLNLIIILGGFFLGLLGTLAFIQRDYVLAAVDFAIYFSLILLGSAATVFALGTKVTFFTSYRIDLILRFIPAYIAILLFAMVMEKVREIIQHRLKESKLELEKAVKEVQDSTADITKSNQELQAEITERQRIEKALCDSEEFLEDVIESIQDGISVLNPDLTIRHANAVMKQWYQDSF